MSIRLRLALVFSLASVVVLSLGSWLFVVELTRSLQRTLDSQLAVQLTQARRYLPAPGTVASRAGAPGPGEYLVQVVDPSGRVRGASAEAGRTPLAPAADLLRARHAPVRTTVSREGDRLRLLVAPMPGRHGWLAIVGISLETLDSTVHHVVVELVVAGGAVVLVAAGGAYALARAALSPVEHLRRQVARLSESAGVHGVEEVPRVRVPRTRDEIAALATTMNRLLDRLHGALARQRELVADASHELRTPFAVLSGELELAARPGRSREELAEAVERARHETLRLTRLTEQLLFLARSDEDRRTPSRQPTDLHDLLAACAARATTRAERRGVRCEVDAPHGPVASVDPDRVGQAIDNLVDNALRFAPAATAIELAARVTGSDLAIEVADRGPGFPEEFLPRAFERFARPDSGRGRREGGAGLGLAIVSAVAEAHGGRALAVNRPGGGALVRLEMPGCVVETPARP